MTAESACARVYAASMSVEVAQELVSSPPQVRRRQHSRRRSPKAVPPRQQHECDDRHHREPRHEAPDLGEFRPERASLDLDATGQAARDGADRTLDDRRQAKRLVPDFAGVQLVDEAGGVFGDEDPDSCHRRAEPGPVERPHREQDRGDEPVDHEGRQAARQRSSSARPRRRASQPLRGGCDQVGQDERQERHQEHTGGRELIEDDRQHHEGDDSVIDAM